MTHTFDRLQREADLPPVRFHDLRHGAASLPLAAGNDLKIVQALLEHASIMLTADTYTSVLPCLAHQAAEATAELDPSCGPGPLTASAWPHPPEETWQDGACSPRNQTCPSTGSGDCLVHGGHTSGSQIDSAHQQDPLHRENLLVGVDITEYAARDSNPEPAG